MLVLDCTLVLKIKKTLIIKGIHLAQKHSKALNIISKETSQHTADISSFKWAFTIRKMNDLNNTTLTAAQQAFV